MKFKKIMTVTVVMSFLIVMFCVSTFLVRSMDSKMVHVTISKDMRNTTFMQDVPLEANGTYKISVKYKFIKGDLKNASVYLSVLKKPSGFVASSHVSTDHAFGFSEKVAMEGWNGIECTFTNKSDNGSDNYKIGFYIDTNSEVEFYFADFKVVDVNNPNINLITNSKFTEGLYGWNDAQKSSTTYTYKASNGGSLTATLEDYNIDYFRIKQDTVYVSSSGNDENMGTLESPLKTFEGAYGALESGGTIVVIDQMSYPGTVSSHETVKIVGKDSDSRLNLQENAKFKGNLVLENIYINNSDSKIFTDGYILQIGEGVSFKLSPEVYVDNSTGNRRVELGSGTYENVVISNSGITKLSAAGSNIKKITLTGNTGSALKAELDSPDLFEIKYGNSQKFSSAEIVNNNTTLGNTKVDDGIYYIASQKSGNSKVGLTNRTGVYNVVTEKGKLPVAVSKDGTRIYTAANSPADSTIEVNKKLNNFGNFISYRNPLSNTYKRLTEDKELRIVYFGGSVTDGYGSSDKEVHSWRALVKKWFETNFPEAKITNINRALGESGTYLGSYRVQRDVINEKPDLVFVEYAINDYYFFAQQNQETEEQRQQIYKQAALQYETIVREIKSALPDCDIVTILTTEKVHASTALQGKLHREAQAHEDISVLYNIPTIKVGLALFNKLGSNYAGTWSNYFIDIVHPTDEGYAFYYSVIEEYLNNSLLYTDYGANIYNYGKLPSVNSDHLFDGNRTLTQPTAKTITDSQALGGSGFVYNPDYYGIHNYYGYISSSTKGAELCLQFTGTEIAIYSNYLSTFSGTTATFEVSVDGGEYYTVNCTTMNPTVLASGLASGTHTIKIKPDIEKNGEIKIGAILTIDDTKHTLKGSSTDDSDEMQHCSFVLPCDVWQVSYVQVNTTLADFEMPAKEGYKFVGWVNSEGEILSSNHVLAYGEVITAKFEPVDVKNRTLDPDVNSDEEVNSSDILALKKILFGMADLSSFDVNGDGICDVRDVVAIKKILGGLFDGDNVVSDIWDY